VGAQERDAEARHAFAELLKTLPSQRVVVIDETSTHCDMYPRYARAPKGKRALATARRNYGQNVSVIASLTLKGSGPVVAVTGAVNTAIFTSFIRDTLVPTLQPGDIVLMDNLRCHKATAVQAALDAAGARLLFLPAYSPDFSPIENAFSKVKACLARLRPQTPDALYDALHHAFDAISARDAHAFFRAAGFSSLAQFT